MLLKYAMSRTVKILSSIAATSLGFVSVVMHNCVDAGGIISLFFYQFNPLFDFRECCKGKIGAKMEARGLVRGTSREEKKAKRREILERKKAVDELIKSASAMKDHLASFSPFRHYDRKGLSVYLESGVGDKLSSSVKQFIQNLLKANMEAPYGPEWVMEEKVKRREMAAPEARYIFLREALDASGNEMLPESVNGGPLVGFVHYRFTLEEDTPVLYVYEIQLESRVQGKGLGKFLMQLLELIARKNHMGAVVLTVQKANISAMNFYTGKLRYVISSTSPSRVDPLSRVERSYEILCKAFDQDAKATLEEGKYAA